MKSARTSLAALKRRRTLRQGRLERDIELLDHAFETWLEQGMPGPQAGSKYIDVYEDIVVNRHPDAFNVVPEHSRTGRPKKLPLEVERPKRKAGRPATDEVDRICAELARRRHNFFERYCGERLSWDAALRGYLRDEWLGTLRPSGLTAEEARRLAEAYATGKRFANLKVRLSRARSARRESSK